MIPSSYQDHLKSQFNSTDYALILCLIQILQSIKSLSLEKLANALPLPILFESRRKKLQRLLILPHLGFKTVWFPILLQLIPQLFPLHSILYLAVDRTSWRLTNLLVISLIYDKRAIPVYIQILDKKGSSNLAEQQQVIEPVIRLLKDYEIVILGDREFCSVKLATWLHELKVSFALRLKKNEYIQNQAGVWTELSGLGIQSGMSAFLQGVSVTKQKGFATFNVAAKWQRPYQGWLADEGWFILTNLDTLEKTIKTYKKRFDIEELFRDCKSSGYHLEETWVTGERLIGLLVLMTLAYTMTTLDGKMLKKMGIQKYIGRIQERGRSVRRHSSFHIGLYGHTWVNFYGNLQSYIVELMRLNSNKRHYYRKGLRAMELVLSAL